METLNEVLAQILSLKDQGLVMVVCIALGYVLKITPVFPNTYIPHAVILFGAALNPCIVGRTPDAHNPLVVLIMQGFVIGAVAFATHHLIISKIEERIKGLFGK
jgi:hypothetical protein